MSAAPTTQPGSGRDAPQTSAGEWRPGEPLPRGWYAGPQRPEDPGLKFGAAAAFLGCGTSTVHRLVKSEKLTSREYRRRPGSRGSGDSSDFVTG
jgi:hypothetical protein